VHHQDDAPTGIKLTSKRDLNGTTVAGLLQAPVEQSSKSVSYGRPHQRLWNLA